MTERKTKGSGVFLRKRALAREKVRGRESFFWGHEEKRDGDRRRVWRGAWVGCGFGMEAIVTSIR